MGMHLLLALLGFAIANLPAHNFDYEQQKYLHFQIEFENIKRAGLYSFF
jgi:hypothetical protein